MTIRILYILYLSTLMLSCDNNKDSISNKVPAECILKRLPKTLDYLKNLQTIQKISSDTLVQLEKVKLIDKTYTTLLDIKENEVKAWINIVNSNGDSIKIELHQEDYVEYIIKVATTFDIKSCSAIRRTETLNLETNKTSIKSERIDLSK